MTTASMTAQWWQQQRSKHTDCEVTMTTAMMREWGSGGWAPPVATLLCILPVVVSLFRSLINVIVFHSKEYCDNYNVYMWHTLCTLSKCTVYFANSWKLYKPTFEPTKFPHFNKILWV